MLALVVALFYYGEGGMQEVSRERVRQCEARLRQAMLDSDVTALEMLLDNELIFVSHLGQPLGRSDDLDAHRSGLINIQDLQTTDERIVIKGNVAVVSLKTHIAGSYGGQPAEGVFRFTRTWLLSPDSVNGRVIAATSVLLP
ncbi:nuclear transport factor 2 family protein [Lonsdalea populi]|uniref:nuclear transport factor 2 family protein n=1 Tax=Lonsdalea populi TaxID=1172565 RepID=UPI001C655154|nr:nuclear transport factor 2 family protein [Lonsdalea populi]